MTQLDSRGTAWQQDKNHLANPINQGLTFFCVLERRFFYDSLGNTQTSRNDCNVGLGTVRFLWTQTDGGGKRWPWENLSWDFWRLYLIHKQTTALVQVFSLKILEDVGSYHSYILAKNVVTQELCLLSTNFLWFLEFSKVKWEREPLCFFSMGSFTFTLHYKAPWGDVYCEMALN